MQRITPGQAHGLFDTAATRALERDAAACLPPHTLMARAGLAVARLAAAVAPHARTVWIACGPGNNGGDGLEAAHHLQRAGRAVTVSLGGSAAALPADASRSLARAREAGVAFTEGPPPAWDLGIDALLGLGATRPLAGQLHDWARALNASTAPVLAVDLPSGLNADTGTGAQVRAHHTLSLLTLKPGLFTAGGRDASGQVWLDALGVEAPGDAASAVLAPPIARAPRRHDSHKGSYADVAVLGGAPGMAGAAVLAATAALHGGAGRVFLALLDEAAPSLVAAQPELMLRTWNALDLATLHVVCGCGGGDAVRAVLPAAISRARSLVLDADALNAVATDSGLQALVQARSRRGLPTVFTPHPLEAARLLGCGTAEVQADRLKAAIAIARRFGAVVVLKGSGTVIAMPERRPVINLTGNARLATAGTGDVLAGWIGARLAEGLAPFEAAVSAVHDHGAVADRWPAGLALTAAALARAAT